MRGPLAWPAIPAMTTRRDAFDDLVLDSADRFESILRQHRLEVEFAVEDVPPGDPAPWEEPVPALGRVFPSSGKIPARIVLYRRAVENEARDHADLALLVHDVVLEQIAALLQVDPEELDR